jgi:hypothetical protein
MRESRSRTIAWITRSGRAQVVLALVIVGLGAGAAIAVAGVPGSDGTIHACYQTDPASGQPSPGSNFRIIDPAAGQSCNTVAGAAPQEGTIAFNTAGPAGAQGPAGPQGAPGAAGQATIPIQPGGRFGTLTLTGGGTTLSADIVKVSTLISGPGSRAGGLAQDRLPATQIEVTKSLDKSSPKLAKATIDGKTFSSAAIVVYEPGTTTAATTYKLKDAQLASEKLSAGAGDAGVTETIIIVCRTLQVSTAAGSLLPAVQKFVGLKGKAA